MQGSRHCARSSDVAACRPVTDTNSSRPIAGAGASRLGTSRRNIGPSRRNGPPCETMTQSRASARISARSASTRWTNMTPLSPPGAAKPIGSAAQRSSAARGTSSQSRPSHSPKSSSIRRGSTWTGIASSPASACAGNRQRDSGLVRTIDGRMPASAAARDGKVACHPSSNGRSAQP